MGTVGLSFGSPTSGAGFDVTSTVNQIVANLQAVETPWKNQLSSLQAQDAALSGIGSDLSKLTTALQTLNDFQGVLSEKQGSSSDTDVLQLLSASTSTIAGTHSIVVQHLASTSSYVSNSIADAGDTLSGSLVIAINGKSQTINIDNSNNTLASLANAINSGNFGVTANVITDSSGSRLSLVSKTSGAGGSISITGSLQDSSTSSQVSFTQTQSGSDAQMLVDGIQVSSSSNTVANAIPGVTLQLLGTSPTSQAFPEGESVQVEITNNNSDVETALSNFINAYNTVMGDLNAQEGNDANGNPEPLFGNPTLANLQVSLESALTFLQPSNVTASTSAIGAADTFSGNISIQVGNGSSQSITVPQNATIADVASAINAANLGVTASVITSGQSVTLSLASSTGNAGGAITVDGSGLTDTTTNTAVTFGAGQSNGITSLTQLGVSANNDGTLNLNSDTLESLLNTNFQDVVNFFQSNGTFASFGGNFTTVLNNLGNSNSTGVISQALHQNSQAEQQLNTNISNEETLISTQKATLTAELNQANFTLAAIPQQIANINEIYSAITGFNEKNG